MLTRITVISVICFLVLSSFGFSLASEPGSISGKSGVTVQELVGQRNANTRVWEYTKQVPVVEEETGITEMVTVKSQVIEKGNGLCYDRSETDTPDWVPSVEEITPSKDSGVAYEAKQGIYQVSFTGDLTSSWSVSVKVNNQTIRSGVRYLGYYDSSNGSSVFLATPNAVKPQLVSPNKLVYRNAFPGIDIEYVYTKGEFQQNAMINSMSSYQPPSHYGLNPASTQLIIATELDLATTANLQVAINMQKYADEAIDAGKYPIELRNSRTGKWLSSFEPNQAFDSNQHRKEVDVNQRIISLNQSHYLVEGVPFSWITSAILPVTIDYNQRFGGLDGSEVWRGGQTYWVSAVLDVNAGATLVIDAGAIVKLGAIGYTNSSTKIRADADGQIHVMGRKFNYVIFTSVNDNTVGIKLDNELWPTGDDYSAALVYNPGARANSRVNYAKFQYGIYGIRNYSSSGLIVRDCIFGKFGGDRKGTAIFNQYSGTTATIKNNLFFSNMPAGQETEFGVVAEDSADVGVCQNTFDWYNVALEVKTGGKIRFYDNIISNGQNAAVIDISTTPYGVFPENYNNAFWRINDINPGDTTFCINSSFRIPSDIYGSIYASSPNGDHYLAGDTANPCRNCGSMSSESAEMDGKTTYAPYYIHYGITNIDSSMTWSYIYRDYGTVDLGFHYDPVDIVIGTDTSNYRVTFSSGTISPVLTIYPGVVVSFYRDEENNQGMLKFRDGAKFNSMGTDTDFVQFTSIYATSDKFTAPCRGGLDLYDYSYGLNLHTGTNPDSNIQYCEFQYANAGIRLLENLNQNRPIQNNYFNQNYFGVTIDSSGNNLVNNLFDGNRYGAAIRLTDNPPSKVVSYIQSNTWYNNDTGLWIIRDTATAETTVIRLENNIFTSNIAGAIGETANNGVIQSETRNNLYWNNQQNVDGNRITLNTSATANNDIPNEYCSMLAHKARLSDDQKVVKFPHDGFYLAQRDGDASRFPLRTNELQAIDTTGLGENIPNGNSWIETYAVDNETMYWLGSWVFTEGQSSYSPGSTGWGNLLIKLYTEVTWEIESGNYITLTFGKETSKLDIYLPPIGLSGECNTDYFWIWVAQDGSCYHGRKDHTHSRSDSGYEWDQDAEFASQWDMPSITGKSSGDIGLAMSAYDGGARSTAIDKGSVRVISHSVASTNSDAICSVFASSGSTNTDGSSDNSTTLRWTAETTAANYTDPAGRLDLGYHYNESVVYVTDIVSTFRYNNRTYAYDIMDDYLGSQSAKFRKVVAGNYDSATTFNSTNVVIFPASGPQSNYHYMALGYHVQGTPIVRGIAEYSCPSNWDMWINQVEAKSAPDGTIFSGIAWSKDGPLREDTMNIYRYDATSSIWTTAVTLQWTHYGDTTLKGFAMAADTGYLWQAISVQGLGIKIAALPYSSLPVTLTLDDSRWVTPSGFGSIVHELDMSYDEKYTKDWGHPTVRMIYYKDTDTRIHGGRVEYKDIGGGTYAPSLTADLEVYSSTANDSGYHIVCNPNDVSGGIKQAFAAFETGAQLKTGNTANLNATNPNNEFWNYDTSYSTGTSFRNSVTYRWSGDKLVLWATNAIGSWETGSELHTNHGDIAAVFGDTNAWEPSVYTNPVNKRELVASWHTWYDLNGDQYENDEGVFVCRELLP